MNRKNFLRSLAVLPLTSLPAEKQFGMLAKSPMKLQELNKITEPFHNTEKMPVLFLGHGSPMNAIEENEFVAGFRKVAKEIPEPTAVLCISAH